MNAFMQEKFSLSYKHFKLVTQHDAILYCSEFIVSNLTGLSNLTAVCFC
jgi:hypothetical protein